MDAFSVIAICAVVLSIVVARTWLVITSVDDMITHSHPEFGRGSGKRRSLR